MKLSIVIPVYNAEKYIGECLESVLQQNFEDYEMICINDGSTDESERILQMYATDNPKIRIFHQENRGQSVARNIGLQHARGEYLCFLDSDDMLMPGALQRMYHAAEENQIEILSYEVASVKFENEKLRKEYGKIYTSEKHEYPGIQEGNQLFIKMMDYNEFDNSVWLLLINREWLKGRGIQFYPGIYYEDGLFVLQCFLACSKIHHVKQKNYIYRVRENSTMRAMPQYENIRSWLVILKEIQKLMNKQKDESIKQKIVDYAERVVRNATKMNLFVSARVKDTYKNFMLEESFFAVCMGIGTEDFSVNECFYLKGFIRSIQEESKVIIYGAGEKGHKMYQYLQKEGLEEHVSCFAVTEPLEDNVEIMGVPVYPIHSLTDQKKEVFVLIAANRKNRKEMRALLQKLGFVKVEEMNDLLEGYIEKQL